MCDAIRRVARKAIPLAAIRKLSSSRSSKRTNVLIDRARFLLAWFCGFVCMGFSYLRGITSVEKLENRVMRAVLLRRRLREALVALQTGENLQGSAVPQRQELGSGACVSKRAAAFSPHVKFSDWPYSLSRPAICPGYRTRLKQPRAELLLSYRADGIATPEKTPALVGPPSLHLGLALKAHRS